MLHPKQREKLDKIAKNYPSALGLFISVFTGKASPRKRIKAFCMECFGFDDNFRNDIRACTSPACPLFELRPFQHKTKEGEEEEDSGDGAGTDEVKA
jgi:hypothetical protein